MKSLRPNLSGHSVPLESTYSPAEVGEYLGICRRTVYRLVEFGRKFQGVHPLRGGLWPSFRPPHGKRRITASAVARHVEHIQRLENDGVFRAQMWGKARGLGLVDSFP